MSGGDHGAAGIDALHAAFREGRADPLEVTQAHLERVASRDPQLHAFITVAHERALADARASQARWRAGRPLGLLDGVPVGLKDNIDVAGLPCTAGTAAYRDRIPAADAPAAARLAAAGAVLLGKLNMHEGALGATTDNPVYGRAGNPLAQGLTPGGSSGGSGAAVAAGLCVAALGTDTMGSVRVPAAYCGVFGFKPSAGAVSTDGVVPLSATLDAVGPIARSARDTAIVAATLLGQATPPAGAAPTWRGLRIGRPRQLAEVALENAVADAFAATVAALAAAGARVVDLDLPAWSPGAARRAGLLVSEAEGYEYWRARLGDGLDGLSAPFAAMLRYPARVGDAKLHAARATIAAVRTQALRALDDVDLLVMPTTPQRAFAHTQMPPIDQADCTALANFAGAPAFAFPVGALGLPASVQLLAAPGDDARLLALADAIDRLARACGAAS